MEKERDKLKTIAVHWKAQHTWAMERVAERDGHMSERASKRTHEPAVDTSTGTHDGGGGPRTPPSKKALSPGDVAGAEERALKEASDALAAKGSGSGKGQGGRGGGGRGGAQQQPGTRH